VVPVSLDPPDSPPRISGNRIAQFLTGLPTDIDDPFECLRLVCLVYRESRHRLSILGEETANDLIDLVPPLVAVPGMRFTSWRNRRDRSRATADLVVSNMVGPREPWSIGATGVEGLCMTGPVVDGVGVNISFTGYCGMSTVAVRSNPKALGSPSELAHGIVGALDELSRGSRRIPVSPVHP
jgi:hypothetical protein